MFQKIRKKTIADNASSFRWVQVCLDYICDPDRPGADLLQVLESIPDGLSKFYFKLLKELTKDKSKLNRELGSRALKWLLGTIAVSRQLRTKDFIKAVCFDLERCLGQGKYNIHVDHIRVACHHLVVWNERSDCFEFGHYSVLEFFAVGKMAHDHYDEVQMAFGTDQIWPILSLTCIHMWTECRETPEDGTESGSSSVGQGLNDHPLRSLYWDIFCYNAKTFFEQSFKSFQLQSTSRLHRQTRIAIIADGFDYMGQISHAKLGSESDTDVSPQNISDNIESGESYVRGTGDIDLPDSSSPWWISRTEPKIFNGTQMARFIHQINPNLKFHITKVCKEQKELDESDNLNVLHASDTTPVIRHVIWLT